MPDYDGDIKLKVSLTPGDIKSTAKELQNELKQAFNTTAVGEMSKDLERVVNKMQRASEQSGKLTQKIEALENTKIPTEDYKAVQNQISETEIKLAKLNERMEKYLELGGKTKSTTFRSMQYDAAELSNTLEYAKGELQDLVDTGKAFTLGSDTAEYSQAVSDLAQVNNESVQLLGSFESLSNTTEEITSRFSRLGAIGSKALSLLVVGAKRVVSGLKSMVQHLKSSHTHSKGLGGSFKTLLKYGLGIRSLYVLFNKLRNAIKEGFSNLRQYDSALNGSLTAVSNATTQLKNSVAAAISPLANALLPLLTTIISRISETISLLGAFFAMLSGKSTFVKATEVQEGYADSLNNSAGAAKNLRKQLAGFDELNTLSGDNSGGGGGGAGAGVGDMFTTEEIPIEVSNFVDRLKEAWLNADFSDMGRALGKKISDAFETAGNFIDSPDVKSVAQRLVLSVTSLINGLGEGIEWANIGNAFTNGFNLVIRSIDTFWSTLNTAQWGKGLGDALNTIVNGIQWVTLGHAIGERLNRALDFAYNLLTTFDFLKFGTQIATSFNHTISTIDWSEVAGTISSAVTGGLDFLIGLIEGINWQQLGDKVYTVVSEIDWTNIVEKVFELLGSIIGGLAGFFWGVLKNAWTSIKSYFSGKIEEMGGDIVGGILKGILDALLNITGWLYEHVFLPIWNGVKKAFGISSPSKKMAEIGRDIIQGMINGIAEKFTALLANIKQKWETVKTQTREKWEQVRSAVAEKAENIRATLSTKFESAKSSVVSAVETLRSNTINKFIELRTNIADKMSAITSVLKGISWSSIGSNLVAGLKQGIVDNWNSLLSKVGSLASKVTDKVKSVFGIKSPSRVFRDEIGKMIPEGLAIGVEAKEDDAIDAINSMSNAMVAAATDFKLPDIITGKVLPYSMSGNPSQRSTMQDLVDTLKSGGIADTLSAILSTASQEISELRTQNELLTQLLNKQLVIQPSASLGRIVAQSTAQYNKVVGR